MGIQKFCGLIIKVHFVVVLLLSINSVYGSILRDSIPNKFLHTIELKGIEPSGKGWEIICSEVEKTNNLLIGEAHGTYETPLFLEELFRNYQFDYLVTEIDQRSATVLNHVAESDLKFYLKSSPGCFGMYSTMSENRLLYWSQLSGAEMIGIDMISPVSLRLYYHLMTEYSEHDEKTMRYLEYLLDHHNQKITDGKAFTIKDCRKELIKLQKLIKKDHPDYDEINTILSDLYPQASFDELAEERRRFMSNALDSLYDSDLVNSRIMYKFGTIHTRKNRATDTDTDVGNFVEQKDSSTYHLAFLVLNGQLAIPSNFGGKEVYEYSISEDSNMKMERTLLSEMNIEDRFTFLDVKSLREDYQEGEDISEELQFVLDNYDGIVIMKDINPATPF